MSGVRKFQSGELIAMPRATEVRVDRHDADAAARAQPPSDSAADLHNVIPFMRPRAHGAHAPEVGLPSDATRLPARCLLGERARLLGFAALSLIVHGALFAAFWREPTPLASIGVEVISVEIVVGATAPAGIAQAPGEQEVQAAAAEPDPQPVEPMREAAQRATEQPQNIPVAREETAPEQTTALERQADNRPEDTQAKPLDEQHQAEPKPSIAMVPSPQPDTATAAPREIPPDTTELSLLPQPEEKPVEPRLEPKPEPKPVQAQPPKPVKNAAPAKERRRIAAPTRENAAKQSQASTPSTAANNVGVGRSDNETNYRGIVAAHLARHKQYPSDARSRGDQGTASVTFGLDGGGRVTSVSLARGSGVSSIDSEVTAMVRRASPFPAPPSGRSVSFTVPVSFRLN